MSKDLCRRSLTPYAIALLLVVLAGCARQEGTEPAGAESLETPEASGAETPAAVTSTPDPCTLVTAEEIEAATGVVPGAGTPSANACSWVAADGSNQRLLTLAVLSGSMTAEQWQSIGGSEDDVVEGVGDFAVWVGSQLQVFQGGRLVGVTVRGVDRPEAAQELALTAHARLAG